MTDWRNQPYDDGRGRQRRQRSESDRGHGDWRDPRDGAEPAGYPERGYDAYAPASHGEDSGFAPSFIERGFDDDPAPRQRRGVWGRRGNPAAATDAGAVPGPSDVAGHPAAAGPPGAGNAPEHPSGAWGPPEETGQRGAGRGDAGFRRGMPETGGLADRQGSPARGPEPRGSARRDGYDSGYRDRYDESGYAPAGHEGNGYPGPGRETAAYADTGYADTGHSGTGYAGTGYGDTGHGGPGYDDRHRGSRYGEPGHADRGYAAQGYAAPGQAASSYATPGYADPGQAASGQAASGHADPGHDDRYPGRGYQDPGYQDPGHQGPGYREPADRNRGYQEPGYQSPGYDERGYDSAGYGSTGYDDGYPGAGPDDRGYDRSDRDHSRLRNAVRRRDDTGAARRGDESYAARRGDENYGAPDQGVDDEKPGKPRGKRRVVLAFVLVLVVGFAGAIGLAGFRFYQSHFAIPDYAGSGNGTVEVVINSGDTATVVGTMLTNKDVIKSVKAFIQAAATNPDSVKIQPGAYNLHQRMSAAKALDMLLARNSDGALVNLAPGITITEGMISVDIFEKLHEKTGVPLADFVAAAKDPVSLGVPSSWYTRDDGKKPIVSIEGFLFPDTYTFTPGETAKQMLSAMVKEFMDATGPSQLNVQAGAKTLGMTPYEALITASIAQAEAQSKEDMAGVSEVVYNRIYRPGGGDSGSTLSIDSEVNYWLRITGHSAQESESLTVSQLTSPKDPYSTHLNPGLPPGAISNPGKDALTGALHPDTTKRPYYYWQTLTGSPKVVYAKTAHEACAQRHASC
ncbi:endolytic transglycosylase MltG [Rugosimonospora africana]|uniref:Endolytic murein transglycosylase n=1 Tax=Rugosimonospora africana TaxID=556532 RepID=A0A8J3R1F1_9ACTN|nr:endolytic transglycosylase MltG [Rugosimonospora africana]GIH20062.1 hypothetical protein Raf01_82340 [Rugosimonospora africana]